MLETRGTILVVEDDDAVRSLAARVLRREGYEVVEAADATRALEAAALSDHPIALLLTDLVLPGESGAELAGTLCAER
ncbi:MAG: response regulator, partial [Gemmatimonadota bacterium]